MQAMAMMPVPHSSAKCPSTAPVIGPAMVETTSDMNGA